VPGVTASVRLAAPSLPRRWLTCFNRVDGDHQVLGDPRVRHARCQQHQDFQLPGGQLLGPARHHHGGSPGALHVVFAAERPQHPGRAAKRDIEGGGVICLLGRDRPDPRRRRRHRPVPRPQSLRVLDRHRPHRRLQRPAHPPPAIARREPPSQPCALYRRDRPAAPRHRRPRLLPAQARRRENLDGSHAVPAAAPVRRRLPAADGRRPGPGRSEPGRAPRGVSSIQRGRPVPGHRHFGSATSRTRIPDATASQASITAHGPRSRCHPAARPR
jgi:hypothetical protein